MSVVAAPAPPAAATTPLRAARPVGILDDTLVYYIIGDNGASAEGTPNGCFNAAGIVNGPGLETIDYLRERIDQLGTPAAYNHYAVGWAPATARSSTGRTDSRRRARSAASSAT